MSRVFQSPEDLSVQLEISKQVEVAFECQARNYGTLDPVDWFLLRNGRTFAYAEFKGRKNPSTQYPTVFFSLAKYHSIFLKAIAGFQGWFVVKWSDGIVKFLDIMDVDPRDNSLGGRPLRDGATNDMEPIIYVPIRDMSFLPRQDRLKAVADLDDSMAPAFDRSPALQQVGNKVLLR